MLSDLYVTTGQAAAMLHVNRLTILRWVQSGRLTGEVVGRITLIPRTEVFRLKIQRHNAA